MRPLALLPIALFAALSLSACGPQVRQADYASSIHMPDDAHPAPIAFDGIELILPVGTDIGYENAAGDFCISPGYPVNRTVLKNAIDHEFLAEAFHDTLQADGYDVVGGLKIAYDRQDDEDRAEYSVKGNVVAAAKKVFGEEV